MEHVHSFVVTYHVPCIPNIIKIHLLQHTVQMQNLTIQPNGVSDVHSPAAIVVGTHLDVAIHCCVKFS